MRINNIRIRLHDTKLHTSLENLQIDENPRNDQQQEPTSPHATKQQNKKNKFST